MSFIEQRFSRDDQIREKRSSLSSAQGLGHNSLQTRNTNKTAAFRRIAQELILTNDLQYSFVNFEIID